MKSQKLKAKSKKCKPKVKSSKLFTFYFLLFTFYFLLSCNNSWAKEIVILYTGETHAMLYPCNCPKEPDGGVARRGTLIKKIKTGNPDTLLLDSGSFFAGGLLDEYTQNTQLDTKRTIINLEAMDLMKYDYLGIGDDEFNFGQQFFLEQINKTHLTFLSCNISSQQSKSIKPYIIKEISDTKIGIIGVTNLAANAKAGGIKFSEPNSAIAKYVAELKNNGADIIVLLSQLEESQDLNVINDIKGIDILIGSHHSGRDQPYVKLGNTLILRPFWQGRSLGKLILTIENNKLTNYKVEGLRLSDEIADDKDVISILPRCFSDANCKREGLIGSCQDPGNLNAGCLFSSPNKIDLTVITSRSCITCNTDMVVNFLKNKFPGLNPIYLYYPDKKATDIINNFAISGLPAYILSKEAEKEKNFESLKANLELTGNSYVVKPQFSGVSYFFNRKKINGKLDLFISLYDKNSKELLEMIKEFNPKVHFLATEVEGKFDAAKGESEVEEYLRAVCIQKYYPENFWYYLGCRAKNINSSWWDDCVINLDRDKIKSCSQGNEGNLLLRENIGMNKELQVMFGPVYLLDNQEIFSSSGVPSKEELRTIIKR
jgi:hypothetical protein